MSDISLEVYLYFHGNAKEAMEFYKSVFGGDLTASTYGEVPEGTFPTPISDDMKDWYMHASLEGGDIKLMASDTEKASDEAKKVDLSLGGTDETRLREIFAKLSEGGTVNQGLTPMYWGDLFGSLTDKYHINWMMNIGKPGAENA